MLDHFPDDLASVARLGDDLPIAPLLENLPEPVADDRVIVAEDDP
jgi:hypothetical protein